MPSNIAPSVTSEYTEAIPVPLDGEYANHTSLVAALLPIANRVEYLRANLVTLAYNQPSIQEDFLSCSNNGSTQVFGDSGPWVFSQTAVGFDVPGPETSVADVNTIGAVRVVNGSGTASVCQLTKTCFPLFSTLQQFSARIRLVTNTTNKAFEFGLFANSAPGIGSGSTLGIGVQYNPTVHANIRTVGISGGVYTYTDTGIAPTTSMMLFEVSWSGSAWTLAIDGVGSHAFAGLPVSTAAITPQLRFGSTNTGSRIIDTDLFYARWALSRV